MGQAHGLVLMGQDHGHMLMGQAHEHMLMGQAQEHLLLAHEHMLRGPSQEAGKPNWRWRVTKPILVRSANIGFPPNPKSSQSVKAEHLLDFGVWEVSQSIGNCLEIDLDEFSAREVPYLSFSNDFDKFRFCYLKSQGPDVLTGL